MTVTIDPRQAIAMHTGAMGVGMPAPATAKLVSVVFSVNVTTTFGEVSSERFWFGLLFYRAIGAKDHDADICVVRVSLWWAVCRRLVIGTRPTRCVRLIVD